MENRKILITGAHSFIGTYFRTHAPSAYEVAEVPVRDNPVSAIDFKSYDTVFHVAAIIHQTSEITEEVYFKVNCEMAVALAKKAKAEGVKQFVFMSTVKVFGENSTLEEPWREDTLCAPSDAYGASKLAAEEALMLLQGAQFKVSIIRSPVVYGAGVKGNIRRMAEFIMKIPLIPLKGIDNKRAMIYVGNLMALIYKVIDLEAGGLFLAGDRETISTSELVAYMIQGSGKEKVFIPIIKPLQALIRWSLPGIYTRVFGSMVIDSSKTFERLNFIPPYSVADGIGEVMDDLLSQKAECAQ